MTTRHLSDDGKMQCIHHNDGTVTIEPASQHRHDWDAYGKCCDCGMHNVEHECIYDHDHGDGTQCVFSDK